MNVCIAERHLHFRGHSGGETAALVVRVFAPFLLKEGDVSFQFSPGTAGCIVRIEGLPQKLEETTYGADSVQAVELAVRGIDPWLRRLSKSYDIFFDTGDPYFED